MGYILRKLHTLFAIRKPKTSVKSNDNVENIKCVKFDGICDKTEKKKNYGKIVNARAIETLVTWLRSLHMVELSHTTADRTHNFLIFTQLIYCKLKRDHWPRLNSYSVLYLSTHFHALFSIAIRIGWCGLLCYFSLPVRAAVYPYHLPFILIRRSFINLNLNFRSFSHVQTFEYRIQMFDQQYMYVRMHLD